MVPASALEGGADVVVGAGGTPAASLFDGAGGVLDEGAGALLDEGAGALLDDGNGALLDDGNGALLDGKGGEPPTSGEEGAGAAFASES